MPSVECIVPYAGNCPDRQRAWEWVRDHLYYPVRVGKGGEPWCKGRAVNQAVEASSADILVVSDADVWCPGIPQAIQAVKDGAGWAMPHQEVHRLSESASKAFYEGAAWDSLPLTQPAYLGMEGGGCVVARRETLLEIPMDERFIGWGQEDEAWGLALYYLIGPPVRIDKPLVHLWHPPQERLSRRRGSTEGWRHFRRYIAARNNPSAMRSLIEEAKRDLQSHQQAVCASPGVR